MPSEVILPRVDMDMATGKLSKWLVEPGARVSKGQPLFEIETDKAAMEIEAPAAGTVRTLVPASQDDIPVGSIVAWIDAEGEPATPPGPPVAEPAVGGDSSAGDIAERADLPTASGISIDRVRATPLARRLAREQGIELATLVGSGPRGRIQAADVGHAKAPTRPTPAPNARVAPESVAPASPASFPDPRIDATRPAGTPPAAIAGSPGSLNIVALRDGLGTPIVLVHGWGSDANGWRPFLQGQRGSGPVLGLDLPGHGRSGLASSVAFDDLVDAIEAALAGADLAGAHLVGHSLGGAVAAAAAARGSLDVRSLLLLAPAGLGPSINGDFLRGYLAATSEASLTPWMRELVADPSQIGAAFVRATLKAREGTALVETQRKVAAAVFPDDTQAFSIRADLARLAIPTRVVFGGADRILSPAQATGLPGVVASHLFPNVGHMPQIEARDAIVAILAQMVGP